MPIANAPYNPITTPVVTCSICRNEQTIARSAKSETLKRWHVVSYPNDCHCPKCSGSKKTAEPPRPQEPKKRSPQSESVTQQYYRAALKLGNFSVQDLANTGLPNFIKASKYLSDLVVTGKLIRTAKAQYAVKPK